MPSSTKPLDLARRETIEQILQKKQAQPQLYNLNIPTPALSNFKGLRVVPMG